MTMPYDSKQKADNIKSILEEKSKITFSDELNYVKHNISKNPVRSIFYGLVAGAAILNGYIFFRDTELSSQTMEYVRNMNGLLLGGILVDTCAKLMFPSEKTNLEFKNLGRGNPKIDKVSYDYKAKKNLKNELPNLKKNIDSILDSENSIEKINILEKTCNLNGDLYGLIGTIDLLSKKYSKPEDKISLNEISKYSMPDSMTLQCMMMTTNGQSQRIVDLSKR